MKNFTILLLLVISPYSLASHQCGSLFLEKNNETPSEHEIDLVIQELYELRVQMLSGDASIAQTASNLFNLKFKELSEYLPEKEIERRLKAIRGYQERKELTHDIGESQQRLDDILIRSNIEIQIKQKGIKSLGDINKIEFLLEQGMSPDIQDATGNTAIMWAIEVGNERIFNLLLKKNANLDLKNNDGFTAVLYAEAVNNSKLMHELIDHKADLNVENKYGWTPLLNAAETNKVKILELILDGGVDVDSINNKKMTALMFAAKNKNKGAIIALLKRNPDLTLKNTEGETALSIAKKNKNEEIIQLLEQAGATE